MNREVEEFRDTLLLIMLDHHERYWVAGDHDSSCPLCMIVIQVAVELQVSISDLKLAIEPAERG